MLSTAVVDHDAILVHNCSTLLQLLAHARLPQLRYSNSTHTISIVSNALTVKSNEYGGVIGENAFFGREAADLFLSCGVRPKGNPRATVQLLEASRVTSLALGHCADNQGPCKQQVGHRRGKVGKSRAATRECMPHT